ncbi:hypothetical protein Goshw_020029, partial [Gossypium schwendimanii]|nr:hypothetical protein [Gossypium schwendimanii]
DLTQHLTSRADNSYTPPVFVFAKTPLSFKRIHDMSSPSKRMYSPSGILNMLATALYRLIRTMPIIHHLWLGLLSGLKKPPIDALRPIISNNAYILCIIAAAGTELVNAYSSNTIISTSLGKVYDPWAFYPYAALLRQAFAHCRKSTIADSHKSLGHVSVPVWLIILLNQLLIIALSTGYWEPFSAVVPLPKASSYALLTRSPLETPLQIQLAYVRHAASVNPESGSNSL